ncbi:exodeoxyribonuclease III [Crenothrix polyspora]|uniref:Exodeoxyribonuclease n=1 Tax=Crenothrix polyspora TaxID=360316 RepID=A0A1R4HGC4_9GAMM|nr:exodeoxyribonuclease III [Crenothrix polyspora]SJM95283.1 Exodeoxyribonuclease [Crenothrix polyspora]
MRIISLNANGIRSAERKGFFTWMQQQNADVICLQETKAQINQLSAEPFFPQNYHCFYHDAEKKGYSGVALYCKTQPDKVISGIGKADFDAEGRFIEAQFGKLSVISLYLPSGSSGEERQAFKFNFLDYFAILLQQRGQDDRRYIICGDWNIAHKAIDLKNWRGNQKNSGFLPEERAWMDSLFAEDQWIDAFRVINQEGDQYTWWSNRGQAWAKNVGWRIDYQIVSAALKDKIISTSIYKDQRFSDHAPLIVDYDL